jgi:hypothetical protein
MITSYTAKSSKSHFILWDYPLTLSVITFERKLLFKFQINERCPSLLTLHIIMYKNHLSTRIVKNLNNVIQKSSVIMCN